MIRTVRTLSAVLLVPAALAAQASPGKDTTYLIRGGTVVTGTGERLPNTDILVRAGRIAQVGPNISAPQARVIDAKGKFIYPGMAPTSVFACAAASFTIAHASTNPG